MSYSHSELAQEAEIIPYEQVDGDLSEFTCGKNWFDDFINTEEIEQYHQEDLGTTRLVFLQDELVAYFSVSANALRDDDYQGGESSNIDDLAEYPYDIPAYLLGHMAVDQEFQGKGIGDYLVARAIAMGKQEDIPFRIMLLHAQEDVVGFYRDRDFKLSQSKEEFPRLMFLDLAEISTP